METEPTESTITSLIYFSIPNRSGVRSLPEVMGFTAMQNLKWGSPGLNLGLVAQDVWISVMLSKWT